MDATPSFGSSMRRLSRVLAAAVSVAVLAPAPASADPRIESVTLTSSGLAGDPLTVEVAASDPSAPVTAVDVRYPGHPGGFSESACTLKPDGRPDLSQGAGKNRRTSFKVPWMPDVSGVWPVTVQVTSGACGEAPKHARKQVKLPVGSGDLPLLGGKGYGKVNVLAQAAALNLAPCRNAYTVPTTRNGRKMRGALACLINVLRQSRGLPVLRTSGKLRRAAAAHTRDMIARRYFDHQGPTGPSFVQRLQGVGYWPATAGENIACGGGVLATPYATFLAWMNSDGHRENMLNPKVRELGTGVAAGAPDNPADGATYTTDFGIRY
jgi:uncharacterized protein YkwD